MPTVAVEYVYAARSAERDRVRPAHRAFLRELLGAGVLLASGPLLPADGAPDGALLLLRADSTADALAALDPDPFRTEGLVVERRARGWDPVIGPWA